MGPVIFTDKVFFQIRASHTRLLMYRVSKSVQRP